VWKPKHSTVFDTESMQRGQPEVQFTSLYVYITYKKLGIEMLCTTVLCTDLQWNRIAAFYEIQTEAELPVHFKTKLNLENPFSTTRQLIEITSHKKTLYNG